VLIGIRYLAHRHMGDLKAAFPNLEKLKTGLPNSVRWGGGSFWMRRRLGKTD